MNRTIASFFVLFVAGGALAACGPSIRVVKAAKTGGDIALVGDREGAMELAKAEMARTCGGADRYDILEEGEAVIGEVTNASAHRGVFGGISGQSESTQKTEWRVKYGCKGAAQPTPAGTGAPTAPPAASGGTPSGQIHQFSVRF